MDLIWTAPLALRVHLTTVLPGFVLGTWLIFFSVKGARRHRLLGSIYLDLMPIATIAAIFVRGLNGSHFSLIQLVVPLTLGSVALAPWWIWRGNRAGHRYTMIGLYAGGPPIAGSLTFLPGRPMHTLSFG